jgi:DNA-binding CsgD family transcriptional regulator
MMMGSTLNGISEELCLYRHGNGVKLAKPNARHRPEQRLINFLRLPFNIYCKNTHGAFLYLNETSIEATGFSSMKSAFGKSVFDISPKKNAREITENDELVMQANQIQLLEEHAVRNDGIDYRFLTVKSPLYDDENNLMGIFGCSVMLNSPAFVDSLSTIIQMGLLYPAKNNNEIHQVLSELENAGMHLSKREIDVLRFLIRGKTAIEIAAILGLSKRTVEHHLENMKEKLHVNSRSELIEKVIEHLLK